MKATRYLLRSGDRMRVVPCGKPGQLGGDQLVPQLEQGHRQGGDHGLGGRHLSEQEPQFPPCPLQTEI